MTQKLPHMVGSVKPGDGLSLELASERVGTCDHTPFFAQTTAYISLILEPKHEFPLELRRRDSECPLPGVLEETLI